MDGGNSHLALRVLEQAPVVILVLDLQGTIQHVNAFFERLTGYRFQEVQGKDWVDTCLPERDRERIRALFVSSTRGEHVHGYVNPIVTRTGEERQIEWTDEFLRDDEGRATGILAIGQDVTERLAAELRHRSVIAAMHDGVVVQAPSGAIMECNLAAERMLGLSADQMAGRTSLDPRWRCVHADGTPFPGETHPAMVTLRTGAPTTDVVMGVQRPDGSLVWLSINSEPLLRPGDHAVVGAVTSFSDITARLRSETTLEATARRLALVLDNVTDGFFTLDREWCYADINPAGARMVGRTPEELVGRVFQELWPEAVGTIWERTYRHVMETGEAATAEDYYQPLDQWFEASVFPFVNGISVFFRDISIRKRAERALEHERARLQQSQALAHVGSWERDFLTNRVWWSEESFRILGFDKDVQQPSYEAYLEAVHPDDRARVATIFRRALEARESYDVDHRVLTSEGQVKHIRAQVRSSFDEGGKPRRSEGTIQDISALVQAELAIRSREARLSLIFNHTSDVMLLLSVDAGGTLRVAAANRGFVNRVSGVTKVDEAALIGLTFEELTLDIYKRPPEVLARYQESLRRVIDTRAPVTFEHSAVFPTGQVFAEVSLVPVLDSRGACVQILWSSHDVTARKQADAQVRASLLEKETLLREIHHRVKNNLQVISGLLHFQSKKLRAPDDVAAFAELRQRIFAMTLLHERLYQSQDVARVAFGDYVRALVTELGRSSAPRKGIRIDVTADEVRLPVEIAMPSGMIVSELVTNVLKYAFPDPREGTATVSVRRAGDRIVLGVDDDGVGFPDGFDPGAGSSFGWELVRTLVMQLDGTVEATTGGGAHVRVSFPAPALTEEERA